MAANQSETRRQDSPTLRANRLKDIQYLQWSNWLIQTAADFWLVGADQSRRQNRQQHKPSYLCTSDTADQITFLQKW